MIFIYLNKVLILNPLYNKSLKKKKKNVEKFIDTIYNQSVINKHLKKRNKKKERLKFQNRLRILRSFFLTP